MVIARSGFGIVTLLGVATAGVVLNSNAKPTSKRLNRDNVLKRPTQNQQKNSRSDLPPHAAWPSPPLGGGIYRVGSEGAFISLRAKESGLLTDDYVTVEKLPSQLSGVLCYLSENHSQPYVTTKIGKYFFHGGNQFIVMRFLGAASTSQTGSVRYRFLDNNPFRDIHVSSDGQTIFWGGGYTGRNDSMSLIRWGLAKGELFALNKSIPNVSRISFSPDSSAIGVIGFDNTDNEIYQDLLQPWQDTGDGWLEVLDTRVPFSMPIALAGNPLAYLDAWRKHPDYTPAIEKDPVLRKYPYWRATNRASRRGLNWDNNGDVFYTHQPEDAKITANATRGIISGASGYPSVWSATLATKTNALVLERGYDPVASPDGRYIAFFGWPLDEQPSVAKPAAPPSLWLFDKRIKTRKRLSDQNSGYVFWTHDSRGLVCVRFPSSRYKAQISVLSLQGQEKQLATVEVRDPLNLGEGRQGPPAPISFKGVSKNNHFLIVDVCEFTGVQGSTYSTERALKAVDLTSGTISTLATAKPPTNTQLQFSWDWFDTSGYKSTSEQ